MCWPAQTDPESDILSYTATLYRYTTNGAIYLDAVTVSKDELASNASVLTLTGLDLQCGGVYGWNVSVVNHAICNATVVSSPTFVADTDPPVTETTTVDVAGGTAITGPAKTCAVHITDVAVRFAGAYDLCSSVKAVVATLTSVANASVSRSVPYSGTPVVDPAAQYGAPFTAAAAVPDGLYLPSVVVYGQANLSAPALGTYPVIIDGTPPVFTSAVLDDPWNSGSEAVYLSPHMDMCVTFAVSDDVSGVGAVNLSVVAVKATGSAAGTVMGTVPVPVVDGSAPGRYCWPAELRPDVNKKLVNNGTYVLTVTAQSACTGAGLAFSMGSIFAFSFLSSALCVVFLPLSLLFKLLVAVFLPSS